MYKPYHIFVFLCLFKMPLCKILHVFCVFIHCPISRSNNQIILPSLENGVGCGWEIVNIHRMICPHHTSWSPSSFYPPRAFVPIPLTTPILPPWSDFRSLILSSPPAPVWCLFIPSQLWPISGIISLVLIHVYLFTIPVKPNSIQIHQWVIFASPLEKITQLEHWCLANPWQQMLGPQSHS